MARYIAKNIVGAEIADRCEIQISYAIGVAKNEVGNGGIVRSQLLHQKVCDKIQQWLESNYNFNIFGVIPSPILGAKGNQEFLIYGQRRKKL